MLPVSTTLVALLRLLYSLTVLIPIVLLTGEPLTWHWLELVPALVLQSMFCLGIAFVVARIGAQVPDTTQALPFIARVWTYTAGVMYSVQHFAAGHGHWVSVVLTVNPGHVYLALARNALLVDNPCGIGTWLLRLDAAQKGRQPFVRLPDSPWK